MTPHAPSPYSAVTPTRTRVKWDNIAIVLIGLVVATFAVVGILASGSGTKQPAGDKPATEQSLATEPAEETLTLDGTLTADDARSLVDEAHAFMAEARWDEAADRLATVPEEFRAELGVEALELELAETRAEHERLRAELDASVEARQWKEAKGLLGQLAKIAALDAPLLEIQAQVERALAPAPAAAAAQETKPEADTPAANATTGGGAATKPKPAASTTKPRPAATTRPASSSTTGGGGSRPSGSSSTTGATGTSGTSGTGGGGSATTGTSGAATGLEGALGSVNLTPAEQAELEAALADAFGE